MSRRDRKLILLIGLAGAVFATLVIAVIGYAGYSQRPVQVGAFAGPYDQRVLNDPLEILLVQSDGQAFATLARDPALIRAHEEFGDEAEAAYRAQRPLVPYLAWASSAGRSGAVPPALAVWAVIGTGLASAGLAALCLTRGGHPALTLVILLMPGLYASLVYLGPEALGLGLAAWGLVAWEKERAWTAAALLALAGLTRETMLIVPAVLIGIDILAGRRRDVVPLIVPFVALATWIGALWLRLGALPTDAGSGRLSAPLVGVLDGLANPTKPGTLVFALLSGAIVVLAAMRARRDPLSAVALAYIAFGLIMGPRVWVSWEYFGRVLLPGVAFGFVALIGSFGDRPLPRPVLMWSRTSAT